MKTVSEALGKVRFRRVVLPGIIVTLGIHPHLAPWTTEIGSLYELSGSVLFLVEIGFFGLIVSSAATFIFYVYEGFRLTWLTNWKRVRLEQKLSAWKKELSELSENYEKLVGSKYPNAPTQTSLQPVQACTNRS